MKLHISKKLIPIAVFLLSIPAVASAQTVQDILDGLYSIMDQAIPVLIGLALLFFLWGLARYMLKTDDVEGKKAARSIMLWGVIILFVMVSVWGLVNFLGDSFNLDNNAPEYPQLQ